MTQISDKRLLALATAEIQIGLAMARSRGVVCGSPSTIKIEKRP